MTKFLLDTGPAQDLTNDRNGVRERATAERRRGNAVGICTPVLGELWAGVAGGHGTRTREDNEKTLARALAPLPVWPYTNRAAEEFGRLFALLRAAGRPMQQIDIQIAAIALTLGCVVVTGDSDFAAVPGLRVEAWAGA